MKTARVISQFLTHLAIERTLSGNTTAAYRRDLSYYEKYLTLREIDNLCEVDTNVVREFVDYLHGNLHYVDLRHGQLCADQTSKKRACTAQARDEQSCRAQPRGEQRHNLQLQDSEFTSSIAATGKSNGRAFTEKAIVGHQLSNSSIARVLAAVRGLHKFALAEGICTHDPAHDVKPPKQLKRLPKAITVAEMQSLIEATGTGSTPVELRDRALCEILYGTGARVSEAVNLSADDLDLTNHLVRLFGKGAKERIVPLGSFAIEAIDAYLVRGRPTLAAKGKGTPALFLNRRGNPLSRQSAWEAIQQAAKRAHLEHISPHT